MMTPPPPSPWLRETPKRVNWAATGTGCLKESERVGKDRQRARAIGPSLLLGRPVPPRRTRTISARMASAISSGV